MGAGLQLDDLLVPIAEWARSRPDVLSLGLVGSWARETPQPDSDVDLILLVTEPQKFRGESRWLSDILWPEEGVSRWHDAEYGSAWSRHVECVKRCEFEFTFCSPSWAATNPIDTGTASVIAGGCRILVDKADLLTRLLKAVSP